MMIPNIKKIQNIFFQKFRNFGQKTKKSKKWLKLKKFTFDFKFLFRFLFYVKIRFFWYKNELSTTNNEEVRKIGFRPIVGLSHISEHLSEKNQILHFLADFVQIWHTYVKNDSKQLWLSDFFWEINISTDFG